MSGQIKVGVIGCGGIAHGHVHQLVSMDGVEVAALMDPDPQRIAAMKRHLPAAANVPPFDDYRKMLASAKLDAAVICSPHNVHHEQIVDSLRAGLHVLVEKPMVSTVEHARSVMAEEKKAGKVVGISYQRHCQGAYQFIKKCIEGSEAGPVQFVSAFQGQDWFKATKGSWRQDRQVSCGGQLNDSGSHLVDIILWMTGLEAALVSAQVDNLGTEVDINSAVTIEFTNGAQGNISIVGNCPVFWEDITIVCAEWAFFIRQGQLTYSTGTSGELHKVDGYRYGSPSTDHNFVDAIRGRAQVLAPTTCGLRTIELTEALWQAGETGQVIRV